MATCRKVRHGCDRTGPLADVVHIGAYDLQPHPGGGFSFYSPGPKGKGGKGDTDIPIVDLSNAREVSFSYSVKFSKGYKFNKGGKLPGLCEFVCASILTWRADTALQDGGTSPEVAATCSGGRHAGGCFSTRFMFRKNGEGELYLYIPPNLNRKNLCGNKGTSKCRAASSNGKTYGVSVGTGLWTFKPGEWTTLRQVIHLNTPGKRDGFAQVFINGADKPVFEIDQIAYRSTEASKFVGVFFSFFHGGHATSVSVVTSISPRSWAELSSFFVSGLHHKIRTPGSATSPSL